MALAPPGCMAFPRRSLGVLLLCAGVIVSPCSAQAGQGSNRRVILGVDPSASDLMRQLDNAKTPFERARLESQIDTLTALGALQASALAAMPQNMPAEHAQYHPHATKTCALLKPQPPGFRFNWKEHMEAMKADSEGCPICNPPPPPPRSSIPGPNPSPAQSEQRPRQSKPKMSAAEWVEAIKSLGVQPKNDNGFDFSDPYQEWGSDGVFASTKGLVDPTTLPVDRSQYGSVKGLGSDYVVDDILGMENQTSVGFGKAAADGIPASIPLATIANGDPGTYVGAWLDVGQSRKQVVDDVDVNNSVGRVHDIYLQQSGEPFWKFWNPEVTKINNYANDNFRGPVRVPFAVFGGLGNVYDAAKENTRRNQAEHVKYETMLQNMYPPNYPKGSLPPLTSQGVDQLKKVEAQKNLKTLQDAYGNK